MHAHTHTHTCICRHATVHTLLPGLEGSKHSGVVGLAILLNLAASILQHVAQVGMHILPHILHRSLNGAVHQSNKVLLYHIGSILPEQFAAEVNICDAQRLDSAEALTLLCSQPQANSIASASWSRTSDTQLQLQTTAHVRRILWMMLVADSHLDVVRLQVINGLLILLCNMAACWPAHKVLPSAAQAIAEPGLPHGVGLLPVAVPGH